MNAFRIWSGLRATLPLLLALAGAVPVFAQAKLVVSVDADLERRLREDEQGYDIAQRRTLLGLSLAEGKKSHHSFTVESGRTYFGQALCEDACGDIDLIARDAAGNVLDNDEAKGADPILLFRVEATGSVEIVVSMKACEEDACEYGVGLHTLRGNPDGGGQAR